MTEGSLLRRARSRLLNLLRLPLRSRFIDERLARLTQGRSPEDWLARIPANNHLYRAPAPRRAVRDGLSFDLDISDYMEWMIYFGVRIEPREPLLSLVRPGDVVIDVGANIGETALLMSRRTGGAGRVFAFEPHPLIFARAQRNLALNPDLRVELVPAGLGAEPGPLVLDIPSGQNRGSARIGAGGSGVRIDVTTLDRFVAERGLEHVGLIKIDVEGFELEVLRGARALLERDHPRLFVEIDDGNLRVQQGSARELIGLLEELGYELTHAQRGGAVRSSDRFEGMHFDVIGAPRV